jgi:magnesium-protoporphyrin IX monomethyl ester (oxidative) cyclase
MVSSINKADSAAPRADIKVPVQETLLTPRFYTTNYDAVAQMDLSEHQADFDAILAELRTDYNRYHFVRSEEFKQSWEHVDGETRRAFIDFLERSCTSEFSGFLLFKELSRKLKNRHPQLSEAFNLLARDEARHAGFLNKAMADFGLSLDLVNLTKSRTYTFFPPEWVIYTVYLSEKIGYWRYILVYRHLEKHPEYRIYPLFRYFESWCQDENRHGDFFKLLLRSQPKLWNTWQSRLWARFFLLTVFATHTLTVLERSSFYESIGIDAHEYNVQVIEHTNETARQAFPSILDTNHPEFFPRLEQCAIANQKLTEISDNQNHPAIKFWQKLPWIAVILWQMLRVYLLPSINAEASRNYIK